MCRLFAAAGLSFDTATATLADARRAAARRYGTPRLQALYNEGGQGRDPQQELWTVRGARVTPQVQLVDDPRDHDEHHVDHPLSGRHDTTDPAQRAQVDVHVTGTAQAADGWTAPVQPYQQSCLLLADPVRGWLVDNVHTQPLPMPEPTAGGN